MSKLQSTFDSSASVSRKIVDCGGARIEVLVQGAGPALVLLPSLGRDAEDFDDVAQRLAQAGHRVLRPEPRGVGASTGPMQGVTLRDLASDIAALIRSENAAPVVVIGHAYGNWLARLIATDYPSLVRAVVLLAAGKKGPTRPDIRTALNTCFDMTRPETERLRSLAFVFFAPGNDAGVWLEGWHHDVALMEREAAAAVPQDEFWTAGGKVPVLDVQAREDVFMPRESAGELQALLGNRVSTVVIANAGHALLPEQPAAVAQAIISFVERLSSA